jgi:hypothetical protein
VMGGSKEDSHSLQECPLYLVQVLRDIFTYIAVVLVIVL